MPPPYGYYSTQQPLPGANYTDYSGYANPQYDQSYGSIAGGYSPTVAAAVNARNTSGISTRDQMVNGQVIHDERATPKFNSNSNAPAFQSAFSDDPFYQRSDVAPFIQATNRDLLGNGKYGYRGWMTNHPVGTIAALAALAYGGSLAAGAAGGAGGGAAGGGAAAGGAGGLDAGTVAALQSGVGAGASGIGGSAAAAGAGATGAGYGGALAAGGAAAGVGFGGQGTSGLPSDLAGSFQSAPMTGSAAGDLAASGGIQGGAGTGILGSTGGSGLLSQSNIGNVARLRGLLNSGGGGQQSGGAQQAPMPYIPAGMLGSQMQQPSMPTYIGLPQSQAPYIPARGYNAHKFYGATVWS